MTDLEKAKNELDSGRYTCVAVKGENVLLCSSKRGIAPILEQLEENPGFFSGASVADKVIGKAAAMLLIYGGVSSVYAETLSEHAATVLEQYAVSFSCHKRVPYIINRAGDGMCPMEKCVLELNDPRDAFSRLQKQVQIMRDSHP